MTELHVASRPILLLIIDSIESNMFSTTYKMTTEPDRERKEIFSLKLHDLQTLHDHITDLLKD